MPDISKVALFTNEYPPHIYGGAGVHAEYLARELSRLVPVEVRCFGEQTLAPGQAVADPNLRVKGYPAWAEAKQNTDPRFGGALDAMYRSLAMAKDNLDASVVHCHTWYVQFAGFLAKKLWGIPFVLTTHSLEPLRPWKVEQLGNAYHLSAWIERNGIMDADAVIAVSQETRNDVLRCFPGVDPDKVCVIHNGIDLNEYRKTSGGPARSMRWSSAASIPSDRLCCSSAASPGRRASSTSSTPSRTSTRRSRWCCLPARPIRLRSAKR